ncbi:PIN domain-containing protein, partial [Synechocystis sp. CACIAM 05]|uniref:PIN domain-containing protein n=1 Tax=Synechocystis sp. CACIAM 05 TaxID=1933929 RepID=UPI00138E6C9F
MIFLSISKTELTLNYVFLDTNILISLGMNQWSLIPKIDRLIDRKKIKLLVPKILKEEWKRNKSKIYNRLYKKINNAKNDAKENLLFILSIVDLINDDKQKNQDIIKIISDIDPEALATQLSSNYSNGIEKIIDHENSIQLDISDKNKIFAATHALEKKAPFHKNNMSMADALMFFNILDWAEEYKIPKILFVSTNVNDFSQNKQEDRESLHSDLQALAKLKEIEIDYFINIVEVLRNIEDSNITENEVIIGKTVSRIILFKNYLNHSLDQTTINQVKLEIEKLEKQL